MLQNIIALKVEYGLAQQPGSDNCVSEGCQVRSSGQRFSFSEVPKLWLVLIVFLLEATVL